MFETYWFWFEEKQGYDGDLLYCR